MTNTANGSPVLTEVSETSFQTDVFEAAGPVLVDFWAPWCPPCRVQAPILEQWAAARADRVRVVKLNAEKAPAIAQALGIVSIPTLIVFREGRPAATAVGLQQPADLDALLDRAAGA